MKKFKKLTSLELINIRGGEDNDDDDKKGTVVIYWPPPVYFPDSQR